MKAIYLKTASGPEALVEGEIPRPIPAAGEVLVRVRATTVMPTELQWFPTFHTPAGDPRPFPIVLGHEFSGVVEQLGAGATGCRVGDEVHGLNDWFRNGAQAEYCTVAADGIAPLPRSLSHVEAATVPISALTAWQGLFDRCALAPGERVLILGGAGAVGMFAVQLAHWRGTRVSATASTETLDLVRSLGAEQAIDHRATPFETAVRDVDVIFDAVGGDTLARAWAVLRPGGRLVTIATSSERDVTPRVRDAMMIVRPQGGQLREIGRLLDAGKLRALVAAEFPLVQARAAFERAARGGLRGKIALRVSP